MTEITSRLTTALADRYAIKEEIGAGGMATVYLAEDLKHRRKVAVKVLRPELAAVLGAERFLKEIEVTANLQHPHILPLFDSGEADGFLYYVMPFVEGESLREKLNREKQLSIEECIEITKGVASALDYAHRNDVIHRDVKPENILLHDGQSIVADFGIALAVTAAGGTRLTETGLSLGTPEYMSPEQAAADQQLDGRSDTYSLGCVLYEMLTGEPPFTGRSSQAILAKLLTEQPVRPRTLRDTIPENVEAAVLMALAKTPADRFVTDAEFAEALSADVVRAAAPAVHTRLYTTLGIVLLAAAAGLMLWFGGSSEKSGLSERLTLAVLPLANLTGDAGQQMIVDGLHEALVNELGQVLGTEVDVKGRQSVLRYRDSELSIPEIARDLGGVDVLIAGGVTRSSDSVRITVRLLDADPERQRWTKMYQRDVRNVLALYGDVAQAVAAEILVEVGAQEPTRATSARSVDPVALELYLSGRHCLNLPVDPEADLERAIGYFERAIARDSTYAETHAGLARAYFMLTWFHISSPAVTWPEMRRAAQTALDIDAGSSEVRLSIALMKAFYDWDWEGADREFQAALEINPSNVDVHYLYAIYLSVVRRHQDAVDHARTAFDLDPFNPFIQFQLAWTVHMGEGYAEAMREAEALIAAYPEFPLGYYVLSYVHGGPGGNFEEAIAAMRTAMGFFQEDDLADEHGPIGYYFGRLGQQDSARAHLVALDELAARGRYVSPLVRSWVHLGLGEVDKAFELLEEGYRTHDGWMPYIGLWERYFFSELSSDPRFQNMLGRMDFPQ